MPEIGSTIQNTYRQTANVVRASFHWYEYASSEFVSFVSGDSSSVVELVQGVLLTSAVASLLLFRLGSDIVTVVFPAVLILYRGFFHPLRKFPGPFGARLSAFWMSWQLINKPALEGLQELHKQYGPIVRVGPSDLSIALPRAVSAVYGPKSSCTKNSFYDLTAPVRSLHSHRIRAVHDRRKRVWSSAFSDKALRGYEMRIRVHRQKLFQALNARANEKINISDWFNFYSYDVMGDLALAQSFNMLETESNHWILKALIDGIYPLELLLPMWFLRLIMAIPGLAGNYWQFAEFCKQRLMDRMQREPEIPDISASLLAPVGQRVLTTEEMNELMGDTQLLITAGSDTTASTLTTIVYELARMPEEVAKLRAELAPFEPEVAGEFSHERIAALPHLNGFINETLRLHPPIPSTIQRKTPLGGIEIDGIYIPGNVTVFCPQYIIGRSESAYMSPESFIPERWYKYPEMVKEPSAFAPFSIGPYACIGKSLALMNIRTTIARLISSFEIHLSDEDKVTFEKSIREHFSMCIEELNVVLTPRA
ncbi:hypothetical protein VTN49DRAFT_5984 [Thermomyces lanuginosus]|uniref:uncharacterized protein n=1 Tax=Thermomyces lanuginosus TaxID=5541 RepID=UPI003742FA79